MKVLLTGGSGFIATHILRELLVNGHETVATVRSADKGEFLVNAFQSLGKISYTIVANITSDGAFDSAVKSAPPFEAVIHTASPFHSNISDARRDILDPAIKGTLGILQAVKDHAPSVKRVVITSSIGAMINFKNHPAEYNDEAWNPTTIEEAVSNFSLTYNASKKFAELAAWDFVERERPNFTIATMNPPFVFGPPLHKLQSLENINTSNKRIVMAIDGSFKEAVPPTGSWMWVDVRDVALAHVRAIERSEAGGRRFLLVGSYWTNKDLIDVIRGRFPELRRKLPEAVESDFPEKIFAFDNKTSKEILGLQYNSFENCIVDTVRKLIEIDPSLESHT
ncbi:methylglyoxal reductase (NADPH-dependent) gre2 [Cladophialophora chaetospira]|uniref:Methylglyoxal reductase (NADPH-dependent) gre2 n=1 Tax=Cladophialophora chaetospira TaxID=386627 RepID=A0AA38XD77_9EURO|nr:methylglyoxal reductase (NADPH-dependent) gre2 [Cladophialophora chaetospira]